MVPSPSTLTRRRMLAATPAIVVPVAGCRSWGSDDSEIRLAAIRIRNDDTERHSITIRVEENEETVFEQTYDLEPNTKKEIPSPVSNPGSYTVFATYEGGQYRRDTTASMDGDDSCAVVVWEIPRSGILGGYENYYTRCSPTTG